MPFDASGRRARRTLLMGEEWLGRLAALEGLADRHQEWTVAMKREVQDLPRVLDEMAASAQRELDLQMAIEREAHQRHLRHLRQDLAACEAELGRVSAELDDTRQTLMRLASRLSSEIVGDEPPSSPPSEPWRLSPVPFSPTTDDEGAQSSVTVSVNGVQRATMGLSLREQLQRLPYIDDVSLSDYADATLHLTVLARRPMRLEDALAWEPLMGLHIVGFRPDQIMATLGNTD